MPQWTVMKSIPSLACFSMPLKMSSSVISTTAFFLAAMTPVWYIGTEPIITGHSEISLFLMASMSPPVLRSITASASYLMATLSFSSSVSRSAMSRDVPRLTFTFTESPSPIAAGLAS